MSGAACAAAGVALGAFAAHGLRHSLAPDMLAVFETAVRYQMYHSFGLLITGLLARNAGEVDHVKLRLSGFFFIAGMVIFSGSLYLLSVFDLRWLGMITPLGGLSFIAGWAMIAWTFLRRS